MAHIHQLIDFTVCALIVREGKILMVDHREQRKWLPPGGHVELAENTDQALLREIKEETGLSSNNIEVLAERPALPGKDIPLWRPQWLDIHRVNDSHCHIGLYYIVRAKAAAVKLNPVEHRDIRWFSTADLTDSALAIPPAIRFYAQEAIRLEVI